MLRVIVLILILILITIIITLTVRTINSKSSNQSMNSSRPPVYAISDRSSASHPGAGGPRSSRSVKNLSNNSISPVLFQGFCWFSNDGLQGNLYSYLNTKINKISKYDYIWLPPPSDAGGLNQMGYTPEQWFNLNNSFGSSQDHINLLNSLNGSNIKPIADTVINHRNGTGNWINFTNPNMGNPLESIAKQDDVWLKGPAGCQFFGNKDMTDVDINGYLSFCSKNTSDECCIYIGSDLTKLQSLKRWDDTCDFPDFSDKIDACGGHFARELAHDNPTVQNYVVKYLQFLQSNGYKGFRFDFVKGYMGSILKKYLNSVGNPFSVGEFWDTRVGEIETWVNNSSSTAFDFPLKFILNNVFNTQDFSTLNANGGMPSLTGWNPSMSVTFIDNHDTYRTSDRFPQGKELLGYVYLLTHPGQPCVFFLHDDEIAGDFCNDHNCCSTTQQIQQQLNDLISLRKTQGIINGDITKLCIDYAAEMYCAYITGSNGQIAVKIGGGLDWSPDNPKNPNYKCNQSTTWIQHKTLCGSIDNIGYCVWYSKK